MGSVARSARRDAAPAIVIAPEAFGVAIDVTVTPPQAIGHDREFQSHFAAWTYAEQLSRATGWAVVDRCVPAEIEASEPTSGAR